MVRTRLFRWACRWTLVASFPILPPLPRLQIGPRSTAAELEMILRHYPAAQAETAALAPYKIHDVLGDVTRRQPGAGSEARVECAVFFAEFRLSECIRHGQARFRVRA